MNCEPPAAHPEPAASFVRLLPKVELHLHLEGSIQPETLRELLRSNNRPDDQAEAWLAARVRQGYRYGGFAEFLEAFKYVALLLETPRDYALVTRRLVEGLALQNVRYAEVTLAAGVLLWKKQSVPAVFEACAESARDIGSRLGVRVSWIFDAVRQFGADHAREVVTWAARFREAGVVAFGIGGDELRGPAELFRDVYRQARDLGLHTTAHAGETAGPEGVRAAVELLGAERIGHGIAAIRDASVLCLLRERQIPLEVCLTSNLATGVVSRIEEHPLPWLLEEGLVVTLNSDDPGLFGTTLEQEFDLAMRSYQLRPQDAARLCENAIRASFLSGPEQEALAAELHVQTGGREPPRLAN